VRGRAKVGRVAKRFVGVPKVKLDVTGGTSMQLIYGDEVDTVGATTGTTTTVTFRGRTGTVPSKSLDTKARLECYFLDVGQGDATLIVTPARKKILIDGGKGVAAGRASEAEQALIWKYRLDEVTTPIEIDLVVLTHADEDHIGGLINLVMNPKIVVKKVVHSGIATYDGATTDDDLGTRKTIGGTKYLTTYHSTLADLDRTNLSKDFSAWVAVLELEGVEYESVRAGDVLDVGDPDLTLEVLGPQVDEPEPGVSALPWFGDKAHTINGHSVVLSLEYKDVRLLFSGDLNIDGAERLLADPVLKAKFDAHVLKAPHHGSHEFTPKFLQAVNPQITSISSGEIPDHGHPRANFLAASGRHSRGDEPLLYSTALSAVFGKEERKEHQDLVDAAVGDEGTQRELFRKLLSGVINVRTDGTVIHAATRVQTGYWWVVFFPVRPAPRSMPVP
jgi:beta-lactamase superfamily II metal-dependent hydrolase